MTPGARPGPLELGALGIAIALAAVMAVHTVNSYDTPWHVRTGALILADGLPRTDPFSYTAPAGAPWVNHEWGADVVMALVHRVGGDEALVAGSAALVVATACLAAIPGGVASPLLLLCAVEAAAPRMQARPHLFTGLLVLAVMRIASRLRARGSRRVLAALLVLQIVWANLHGGFFLGIVLVLLELLACGMDRLRGLPSGTGVRELGAASMLSIGAVVVNPWGFGLPIHAYVQLTSGASTGFVSEWTPPFGKGQPLDAPGAYLAILIALGLAAAIVPLVRGVRPASAPLLQLLMFVGLGLSARRNADLAAFGIAVVAGRLLSLPGVLPSGKFARIALLCLPMLIAVLLARDAISGRYYSRNAFPGRPGLGATPAFFPEGAAAWVEAHRPAGNMLNTYNAGGYLLARLWPDVLVFIDGRNLLYGAEHLQAAQRLMQDPQALQEGIVRWDIGYAVADGGAGSVPLLQMLARHRDFALVFVDGAGAVLVRRSKNPDLAAAAIEDASSEDLPPFPVPPPPALRGLLPFLGLFSPPSGAYGEAHGRGSILLTLGRFDAARRELRRAAGETPYAAEVWFNLGVAELQAGAPEDGERALRVSVRLDGGSFETRRALAETIRVQGRAAEAVALYRDLARDDPSRLDVRAHLAHALREQGDIPGAVRELRAALVREPGRIDLASDLGTLLAEQGELDAAELELRGVLAKAPGFAGAAANLAAVKLLRQDYDQALVLAEQALAASPGMAQALKVVAYAHLGRRDLEPALAGFAAYLAAEPGDLGARTDRAACLADLGRRDEARAGLGEVLRASPGFGPAQELLAKLDALPPR